MHTLTFIHSVIAPFFHIDAIALIMMTLVVFIGLTVGSFSARHMRGDSRYHRFFTLLALLIGSVIVMVSADHLLLMLIGWGSSNFLLMKLMVHKPAWKEARTSGILAGKNFLLGTMSIAASFLLLYLATGEASIQAIIHAHPHSPWVTFALFGLVLGAMTQSAIWPFHRWLISSLNSPTPVSAIMHAGIVNGGGFLLVRFSPLYFDRPNLLTCLFVIGMFTAILGTFWSLLQHDVKRMLACSTMGQMGFMVAQCGLGLFPAAIAHLCWHGMFKAYLFIASGGAAQEKKLDLGYPPSITAFVLALVCGLAGSYSFASMTSGAWLIWDTRLILILIAFISGSQFALPMLRNKPAQRFPLALVATFFMAGLYGLSVQLIKAILKPLQLGQPLPLNMVHLCGMIVLTVVWLAILLDRQNSSEHPSDRILNLYVKSLNASQPHPDTITTHRNDYKHV
jgi:NAD(P)H-quinone oxidoreductase subunit 5